MMRALIPLLLALGCQAGDSNPIAQSSEDLRLQTTDLEAIAEIALAQAWPAVSLENESSISLKFTGFPSPSPERIGALKVVPYQDLAASQLPSASSAVPWPARGLDLRLLGFDGHRMDLRAFTRNPIGGPSIHDLELFRDADGWRLGKLLSATESL